MISICVIFFTDMAWADRPAPDPASGQFTYQRNCARCHGDTGDGQGPDAAHLFPRPRNFQLGVYKLRTTASGASPTDEDLFRSITHGFPGAPMPDWQNLSEKERWQLVYYLKSLSDIFESVPPEPLTLPPRPKRFDVARGELVFQELGCVQCHGPAGRGNGPSASALMDDMGQPILATNLTQPWNYRGGAGIEDIVWRMMTGVDGTPMPSYAEAAPGADVWHMSAYVMSLQEAPQWKRTVDAMPLTGALPTAVDDPRWQQAARTDIRLASHVYQDGVIQPTTVNAASVQAVYNDASITFRVAWYDRTQSHADLPDVLAFMLQPADMVGHVLTLQNWPLPDGAPLDVCFWSAETQQMQEHVGRDLMAHDGPTARYPTHVSFRDGQWVLLFQRPLQPSQVTNAVSVTPDQPVRIALVICDGDNQEGGRHHASSSWVELVLQ